MASRVSKLQRRIALPRKLHILRTLTNSKSVKKSSVIKDAFLYICKLKLQLEAIRREYHYLINNSQEVKVEKLGEKFLVRVTCKKRQDLLVSILDAFEILNLNVFQARVTCKYFFCLEAIVEPNADYQILDVKDFNGSFDPVNLPADSLLDNDPIIVNHVGWIEANLYEAPSKLLLQTKTASVGERAQIFFHESPSTSLRRPQ